MGHRHWLGDGRGLGRCAAEFAWGAAEGADFDQEGLCAEVREVINDSLPAGWILEENQFVGPTPIPEDALNIVRNTIDEIDFWGMAQYYDNGD